MSDHHTPSGEWAGESGDRLAAMPADLRARNPVLFWTAVAHLALLGGFLVGVAVDPRTVGGDPVWLKPAKFAGSIALVAATLAWLTPHLSAPGSRLRRASAVIAAGFAVEIAAIGGQAARATPSHFNTATPVDTTVYAVMGLTIVVVTAVIGRLFLRTARAGVDGHPAFAAGLLAGGALFTLGAYEGGVMATLGAHGVGDAPGLPVVGWAVVGDFRVAHFLGLHALQLLPLTGYVAAVADRRGWLARPRLAVRLVAAGYAALLVGAFALGVVPLVR